MQSFTLVVRLFNVRINKVDLKILAGSYKFKNDGTKVNYENFKKLLIKTNNSYKFYCRDFKKNNHIVEVKINMDRKSGNVKKIYYFDLVEYDLSKVLMLMNENELIYNSQITIIGADITYLINDKHMKEIIEQYK